MNNSPALVQSKLPLIFAIGVVFLLFAIGGAWAPAVLGGLVLLVLALLEYPLASAYLAVGLVLVIPVYVAIPPLGPLPNLPVSLTFLLMVLGINFLESMLSTNALRLGESGRHFVWALILFVLISFISIFDASSTRETVMSWIRSIAIPMSIFWLSLRKFKTIAHAQNMIHLLIVVGVICSLYAIVEFIMGRNILIEKLIMSSDDSMRETMSRFYLTPDQLASFGSLLYRCFSVFISPIEFGAFMSMVLPFPIIATFHTKGRLSFLYALAALLCFVGVFLSFSRGPLLTAILEFIGLGVFLKPVRRIIIICAITGALAIALAWPVIGEYVTSRVKSEDNVTLRFKLWEIGLRIYSENPVLGVGLGNYVKYQNQAERSYRVGPIYESGGDIEHVATVDNAFIQLATETGTLGIVSFFITMCFYANLIKKLYRQSRQTEDKILYVQVLGISFAVFGYFFNALTYTAYSFFVVTVTLLLLFATTLVLERHYWAKP
ncbi:MAG: O-antigen ligase family protein [Methylococcaceae bacterium]|nr:O-antigen ligase family protein [Methylococcaceae bacterium]